MSRMIDRAELFNALANEHTEDTAFKARVFGIIGSMPAVDAEPVVRCKDCAYYDKTRRFMWKDISKYACIVHDTWCIEDYFCAYGERREENENKNA